MTETRQAKPIVAAEAPPRAKASNYPSPFAEQVAKREKRPLGNLFGLTNFGVNHTRLAPGAVTALRHWHTRQDEFVYVLEGHPTLITDAGEQGMAPGMCVGFAAGNPDGHQLVNRTEYDVVLLEVGDRTAGDAGHYPDDDIAAVQNADGSWHFTHKDGAPY